LKLKIWVAKAFWFAGFFGIFVRVKVGLLGKIVCQLCGCKLLFIGLGL